MSVRPDGRIFETLVLAETEAAWGAPTETTKRLLATLLEGDGKRSPLEIVMLALACERLGMKDAAERLARETAHVRPADVPTAAFLLQLRAARGGETGEAVRFLLANRSGKGWRTTIESAWAILGLVSLLDRPGAGEAAAPGRIAVSANGAAAGEILLPGRADPAFDGRISVPEPTGGWGEKIVLRLTYEGRGSAYYTATLEGLAGGENRPAVQRGIGIRREILVQEGDGWKPAEGPLRVGRPVLVHLTVTSSEARDYVMVTDPRPDGFEPLDRHVPGVKGVRRVEGKLIDQVDLGAGWEDRLDRFRREVRGDPERERRWAKSLLREILEARRFQAEVRQEEYPLPHGVTAASVEHRDDRSIFFLDHAYRGDTHLYYFVRPELAGRMHALPPRAEPMYEPEIYGFGTEDRVEVGPPRARPDRRPELPPGVEGLAGVIELLERVDADVLIDQAPSHPRIGLLLMSLMEEPAFRAWLSADAAVRAAGPELAERIEAARRDLATRRLAAEWVHYAKEEWLPHLERAISSDALARRVFEGAAVDDLSKVDNALLWIWEDRALRFQLMSQVQGLRRTAELGLASFRPVAIADVIAALGPKAPSGDALIRWKLSQRADSHGWNLGGLARWMERDLALPVKLLAHEMATPPSASGPVSAILDQCLTPSNLLYRIKDGALWIGSLEDLLR